MVKKPTVTTVPSHFSLSIYFWNSLREQWAASWWSDGQQSSEFLVLGNHGLMTSIMLWDRQNYFQTYEFELIRKWGFYLIPTTEEQRGENFLKAFLLNGLCFLLSLLALTHISSDAAIFMHFRYHLMPQKLVWNRFWLFSLSTGCRIFPFQIGIWYWIFLLILKLGLPEKKKGKCSLLTVHHKNPLHINCIGFDFYALANPVAGLGCNWMGTILLTSVKALSDSFSDVERKIKNFGDS